MTLHYRVVVDITARDVAAAEDLRSEIVGAIEDAHERGDEASADVSELEDPEVPHV